VWPRFAKIGAQTEKKECLEKIKQNSRQNIMAVLCYREGDHNRNRRFKCSLVNLKRSFYRSVNAILGKVLSTANVDVILHLINSKCIPVLLYGIEVCPLNRADMQSLDFCVNRLLMKSSCTNNLSTLEECIHYFNIALLSELLRKRTEKFLRKLNARCGCYTFLYSCLFLFYLFILCPEKSPPSNNNHGPAVHGIK